MIKAFGLIGPFQPPKYLKGYTSVVMMNDDTTHSLFAFVMFPGAYDDIYEIASKTRFRNVFIVPVSLNAQYASDIHRLVTDLSPIKSCVKVIYPGRYPLPVNTINEKAILRGDVDKCTYTFDNGFIAFDYKKPVCQTTTVGHDIFVRFNDVNILLTSTLVNKARIASLIDNETVDIVYVPYSAGYVDQETFLTLNGDSIFGNRINKVIAYGFKNFEELESCHSAHPFSTPNTIRWIFMEDNPIYPIIPPPLAVGNGDWCPSCYFPDYITPTFPAYEPDTFPAEDPEIPSNPDIDVYELSVSHMAAGEPTKFTLQGVVVSSDIYFKVRKKTIVSTVSEYDSSDINDVSETLASVTDIDIMVTNKVTGLLEKLKTNTLEITGECYVVIPTLVTQSIVSNVITTTQYIVDVYQYTTIPEQTTEEVDDSGVTVDDDGTVDIIN